MCDQQRLYSALLEEVTQLRRKVAELESASCDRPSDAGSPSEELAIFRRFAEASGLGFSMADLDGRITYANPALLRMLVADAPSDIVGKHLSGCYTEEAKRKGQQEVQPLLDEHGYWEGEQWMLTRRGTAIPTWHNVFKICDENGNPLRLAVVITDITERKKAEEALGQSLDELRAIYDAMGEGLLVADLQTLRVLRANASICSMLGYLQEELRSLSMADLHPKETLEALIGGFADENATHLPDMQNVPVIRKDGSIFYADVTGDVLTYLGRPCCLGLFRDVTERHRAHAALERERRTLKHMLQASDHERQLIAYDIHDGLAQQLAGAIMQFQVYDHWKKTNPDEAQKAYDGGVMLLKQGHFEARRLISGVRPPIIDESGVVAAIAHLVNETSFKQGPEVQFQSRVKFNRLAPVLENVIYRIVQEGLANASQHSESETVRIDLSQRGLTLRIHVRDWGVGFDPKAARENRFGLEGIRERTRLLGGKFRIRSKPGRGTSLVVEIPLAEVGREA